jgi:hypothetical protein
MNEDASQSPLEEEFSEANSLEEEKESKTEEPRHRAEPIPFPGLPSFSPNQESSAHESFENAFGSEPPARRIQLPSFPEPDAVARPRPPSELPDISKILMHPPKRAASAPHQPPLLEPLESLPHARGTYGARPRGFTLSRAVSIMFVLACVVAAAVYHQALGQSLVWLGEQMGGTQTTSTGAPSTNDVASTAEPDQSSSKTSDTAAQAPNSAAPAPSQENASSAAAPHRGNNSTAAGPSMTQNPPPPVSPLSGITSATTSEPGQETGSAEYSRALELLHSRGGTADSEAVRLLWVSVEKGNPSAELTLAQLYWHGQGVARNCDQTRILLSAAARKGNADAQKLLRLFQREGCE